MLYIQWRIQGRGPGGPPPPVLFLDQTETWRAENEWQVLEQNLI